jgi:hypothetical protein
MASISASVIETIGPGMNSSRDESSVGVGGLTSIDAIGRIDDGAGIGGIGGTGAVRDTGAVEGF